jgi:2-polyprenyl-3-methyl-5-hydroxy-6-metoxy-1,4-benzoquinol methylase
MEGTHYFSKTPSRIRHKSNSVEDPASLPLTWERLIPKQMASDPASQRVCDIHYRRYGVATNYVKGKRVLDIACGTGYGSQMLRRAGAIAVVGVDISHTTVQYARKHYQEPSVEFVCADAEQFECRDLFDVVVSLETIEHVPHPDNFLARLRSLLTMDGELLLSAPLGETRHIDPYHLHAFSQEDVFALLKTAGFMVNRHWRDDFFLTRTDLLHWRQLYPSARPSLREQCFTRRGWHILRDFLFKGGINIPGLIIAARSINS